MTDDQIVAEVRHCVLNGVSHERLQAALAALGLEGGREPQGDALEQIRNCVFRAGCTRQEMADAFSDVGINPNDPVLLREELARRIRLRMTS